MQYADLYMYFQQYPSLHNTPPEAYLEHNVFNTTSEMAAAAYKFSRLVEKRTDYDEPRKLWAEKAKLMAKEFESHWRYCKGNDGGYYPTWQYDFDHNNPSNLGKQGDDWNHQESSLKLVPLGSGATFYDSTPWTEFTSNDDFEKLRGTFNHFWTKRTALWSGDTTAGGATDKSEMNGDYLALANAWKFGTQVASDCVLDSDTNQGNNYLLYTNVLGTWTLTDWTNPAGFTLVNSNYQNFSPYVMFSGTSMQDDFYKWSYYGSGKTRQYRQLEAAAYLLYVYDDTLPKVDVPQTTINVLGTGEEEVAQGLALLAIALTELAAKQTTEAIAGVLQATQ